MFHGRSYHVKPFDMTVTAGNVNRISKAQLPVYSATAVKVLQLVPEPRRKLNSQIFFLFDECFSNPLPPIGRKLGFWKNSDGPVSL